jgi:hypothetical protein
VGEDVITYHFPLSPISYLLVGDTGGEKKRGRDRSENIEESDRKGRNKREEADGMGGGEARG